MKGVDVDKKAVEKILQNAMPEPRVDAVGVVRTADGKIKEQNVSQQSNTKGA